MAPAVPPSNYNSEHQGAPPNYYMSGGPFGMDFGQPMRYPSHMEAVPAPPVVFPYACAPGQGPMYAPLPVPHPGLSDGSMPRGHYPNFLPMSMPHPMPVPPHGTMSPEAYTESGEYLNPRAKEFLPPFPRGGGMMMKGGGNGVRLSPNPKKYGKDESDSEVNAGGNGGARLRSRRRRTRRGKDKQAALQENIRKTVYISDIDQQITEEQLATVFAECGTVVDCRVCGDPNSAMRFAFIEFLTEDDAKTALRKNGTELGASRLRVLPSKTAIVPVNKELMPRNKEEMEQCSRTIYATNIDKKVDREDVKRFFEALCGQVLRLRLLGDHAHSTRIAFVEFNHADSALAALGCSGALLGTMPIRVSPSKTPVRFSTVDNE
eukprot:g1129.t1